MVTINKPIFICTYPKSGTTWLQYIVHCLLGGDDNFRHIYNVVPLLMGSDSTIPKVYKTHQKPSDLNTSDKIIYCIRDVRDVCTSYYFHKKRAIKDLEFSVHFDQFVEGDPRFGKYWDHVSDAKNYKGSILILHYEDLINDFSSQVKKIVDYLEIKEYNLEDTQKRCTFANMLRNNHKFTQVRKGIIGDWKSLMTEAQGQKLLELSNAI